MSKGQHGNREAKKPKQTPVAKPASPLAEAAQARPSPAPKPARR